MTGYELLEELLKLDLSLQIYTDYVEEGGDVDSISQIVKDDSYDCGELSNVEDGTSVILIHSHH